MQQPNVLGEKVFFWYRFYTGALALLYLIVTIGAVAALLIPIESREYPRQQVILMAAIYAAIGIAFLIVFAVATLLPAKPYNWIVGIIIIAIGMTSCCLWPATIPLLIYWIKPETQAFFGRKSSP